MKGRDVNPLPAINRAGHPFIHSSAPQALQRRAATKTPAAAPPVYRPSQTAKLVAPFRPAGAPPVYRPYAGNTTQQKPSPQRHMQGAPPVYRPDTRNLAQAKFAASPLVAAGAPPVYRPANPSPVLQPAGSPIKAGVAFREGNIDRRTAPPVYRPVSRLDRIQPKAWNHAPQKPAFQKHPDSKPALIGSLHSAHPARAPQFKAAPVAKTAAVSFRAIQRQVIKTAEGYCSSLDPHRIVETQEEARIYDEKLSAIGGKAIELIASGNRPKFNAMIADTIENISPSCVLGEDPFETIFEWAKVRYSGLAADMHKNVVLNQDTIKISHAIDYIDTHLSKHSGILVDPTFMPGRNRTDFRSFLESQDRINSIFDTWEGYRKSRPTVAMYRAFNLPTASGAKAILQEGIRPSLVRNSLEKRSVDLGALYYQPIATQLMDRLSQRNTDNQMLQSVSPTQDIAWLVGSTPAFSGAQNTSTNSVYNLSLRIPDIDLIRFDDFGLFSQTISGYEYIDASANAQVISIDETEQFLYYPVAPESISGSTVRPFTEKFPTTGKAFMFNRT